MRVSPAPSRAAARAAAPARARVAAAAQRACCAPRAAGAPPPRRAALRTRASAPGGAAAPPAAGHGHGHGHGHGTAPPATVRPVCLFRSSLRILSRFALCASLCAFACAADVATLAPRRSHAQGFIAEMRAVAMRLHTREQAPKEGKAAVAPESKPMPQARPARARWLVCCSRARVGAACRGVAAAQRSAALTCHCLRVCGYLRAARSLLALSLPPAPQWQPTREGYLAFLLESKTMYDAMEGLMQSLDNPICACSRSYSFPFPYVFPIAFPNMRFLIRRR
jgi:hypothetical protein